MNYPERLCMNSQRQWLNVWWWGWDWEVYRIDRGLHTHLQRKHYFRQAKIWCYVASFRFHWLPIDRQDILSCLLFDTLLFTGMWKIVYRYTVTDKYAVWCDRIYWVYQQSILCHFRGLFFDFDIYPSCLMYYCFYVLPQPNLPSLVRCTLSSPVRHFLFSHD